MSKFKFEREDFDIDFDGGDIDGVVKQSNAKLQEWLAEAVVVYGRKWHMENSWKWSDKGPFDGHTHRAKLIMIEELPKKECEHEPIDKMRYIERLEKRLRESLSHEFLFYPTELDIPCEEWIDREMAKLRGEK